MRARAFHLPPAAIEWMTSNQRIKVLTMGGLALPRTMARVGHDVVAIDKTMRITRELHESGITAVAAEAESLPFEPCTFNVVLAHQNFHRFAPGLVLSEMARVLMPGGCASVSFLVRDDSVPWVKRLIRRIQELDPSAMSGDYGDQSVEALTNSKYFPETEHRTFRHWVPISRQGLLKMVEAQPAAQGLDEAERRDLLKDVSALYDQSAPGADDLKLPYQLRCWRGWVDHEELTAPIAVDDDGLVIPI